MLVLLLTLLLLLLPQIHHIYTDEQLKHIEAKTAEQNEAKGISPDTVDPSRSGAHCVTGPSSHSHHHHFAHTRGSSFHFIKKFMHSS